MMRKFCRRLNWLRVVKWTVSLAVFILISWTYRSWVIHAVGLLSSSSYRECVNRRSNDLYNADLNQRRYVTVADHGRLGNWMFQYASLLGIAKANGFTPYVSSSHMLTHIFKITKVRTTPAECLATVEDPKPISYVDSLNHLPFVNTSLDGYLQSWRYFNSIREEIRKEFQFTEYVEEAVRTRFEDYMGRHVMDGREVISIHVRRGDLTSPGAKRLGFKTAPASYFANAMRYMVKRHPYSVFLIVSDDIEWCRHNINVVVLQYKKSKNEDSKSKQGGNIYVVNPENGKDEVITSTKNVDKLFEKRPKFQMDTSGDFYLASPPLIMVQRDSSFVDLGLLSLANHSIVSVGTFGWWGAWLAGGEVVYYDKWLEEGHAVHLQWTPGDYYPHDWVAMAGGQSGVFTNNVWVTGLCCLCLLAIYAVL